MATLVPNNPYDVTQQSATTNQGIVGGTISNLSTGQSAVSNELAQFNPLPNINAQTYAAQTREVDRPTETAAGQVTSLLTTDNPLLQRARTIATQQMAQRGLVNSSMSAGAGTAAMIDRITPIALQDAQTYNQRAIANMEATNEGNQFNVAQNNQLFGKGLEIASQFGLQDRAQKFQTSERLGSQQFQTGEREAAQKFQSYESLLQREFTATQNQLDRAQQMRIVELQEAGANARSAQQIAAQERSQASAQAFAAAQARAAEAFQAQQAELQRAQEQSLANFQFQANMALQGAQQNFASAQNALDRAQQIALADKSIKAQQDLQIAQQNFASAQAELDRTQQITLADKNISAQQALQSSQQNFQATQADLDRAQQVALQNSQQTFQGTQAGLDRAQQLTISQNQIQANKELQTAQQTFQATQAQLDRNQQEAMTRLADSLNQSNIGKSFAANLTLQTSGSINQILNDPNISPADKNGAISNVINAANSTMQWGSTFYNTTLPTIAAPGGTPSVVTPGPGAGAGAPAQNTNNNTTVPAAPKPAWQTYLDANPDVSRVMGYSQQAAIDHYRQYGAGEQRAGADDLKKLL